MADIKLIKHGSVLIPIDEEGEELLTKWKNGDVINCKVSKVRNGGFHRKFFALIQTIWDFGGFQIWSNKKAMRLWLTIKSGHFEEIQRKGFPVQYAAKSISFASMDQMTFEVLFQRIIDEAIEMNMCGNDGEEKIRENVEALVRFS